MSRKRHRLIGRAVAGQELRMVRYLAYIGGGMTWYGLRKQIRPVAIHEPEVQLAKIDVEVRA